MLRHVQICFLKYYCITGQGTSVRLLPGPGLARESWEQSDAYASLTVENCGRRKEHFKCDVVITEVHASVVVCAVLFGISLRFLLSCPWGRELPEGKNLALFPFVSGTGQWLCDGNTEGLQKPPRVGGLQGQLALGWSCVGSLCKMRWKSFVEESESILATNYFWVITCVGTRRGIRC